MLTGAGTIHRRDPRRERLQSQSRKEVEFRREVGAGQRCNSLWQTSRRGNVSTQPKTAPSRPIRVVVAEDSYVVREFLTTMLESAPEVELLAVCSNREELDAAIAAEDPDVLITDIRMPPSGRDEGISVATALRESHPNVGVVVLSQYAEPEYALALLGAGTGRRAYLLKEADSQPGAAARRDRGSRSWWIGGGPKDRRCADRGAETSAPFGARRPHPSRAGAARRNRRGKEQRGNRRDAVPDQARRREARQLDLLEARTTRGPGRQPARESDADLPV